MQRITAWKNWQTPTGLSVQTVAAVLREKREGTTKRRRLRWRRDMGPWANGFDHSWRDAHRGVHLPEPSVNAPLTPEGRELYEQAYAEARAILAGAGEVEE